MDRHDTRLVGMRLTPQLGSEAQPPVHSPVRAGGWRRERRRRSRSRRTAGSLLAALAALLAKFKSLLLVLPKLKLLTTAATMVVSLAAYAWLWGVRFAAGFLALLFAHEIGHVIQLRREGIRASAPLFVPFLGAVIGARSLGDNALAEARVGLAGPILGTVASIACALIWHLSGARIWQALAFTGFFLNLFNLLPVVPLDGGRAMAAIAPALWFAGLAALIPLLFIVPNPLIVLIVVLGGFESVKRLRLRRTGASEQRAYYRVRPRDRALLAAVYLALIALLVAGMDATNLPRTFAHLR